MSTKSSSDSASTTQSTSEDNRVAVDQGGVGLGKNATLILNDQFSDNVLTGFRDLVSLVRDAGTVVVKTADQANQNAQASVAAVTSAIQNDKLGTSTTEQTLVKYLPLLIGAVIVVVIFGMIFKRK